MRGLAVNLMGRRLIGAMLIAIVVVGCAQENQFEGKRVVPVFAEPRHRVVHQDGDLYLMDIQIQAGDTTLPHTHDSAIIYTFIHDEDGPAFGRTGSETDYAEKAFTHEVANGGPGLLHIIALLNYGPGMSSDDSPASVFGEPQLENPWFRSFRVELAPGAETVVTGEADTSVVVQVSEGTARVTRHDGLVEELYRMGSWVWREADSPFSIRNVGTQPIALIVNQARL